MDFLFFPTRKATATIAKPFQWISLWLRRKVQFVSSVPGPHENRTTQISVTEANNTCVYDWRTSWGLREMSFPCWKEQISLTLTSLFLLSSIFKSKNIHWEIMPLSMCSLIKLLFHRYLLFRWGSVCAQGIVSLPASFCWLWSFAQAMETSHEVEGGERPLSHSLLPSFAREQSSFISASLTCTKVAKIILSKKFPWIISTEYPKQ